MNIWQKIILTIGLILIVIAYATAPMYVMLGQQGIKMNYGRSGYYAQIDFEQVLLRILIICVITGSGIWILKSPKKGDTNRG